MAWPPTAETVVAGYREAQASRKPWEPEWHKQAQYCWPVHAPWWGRLKSIQATLDGQPAKKVYESVAVLAAYKQAIALRDVMVPRTQRWHGLECQREELIVSLYLESITEQLFRLRYAPATRFELEVFDLLRSCTVYGTGIMYVGWGQQQPILARRGLFYHACQLWDIWLEASEMGAVIGIYRRAYLNYRQLVGWFPGVDLGFRSGAEETSAKRSERQYEVVHYCSVKEVTGSGRPVGGLYFLVGNSGGDSAQILTDKASVTYHDYPQFPYIVARLGRVGSAPYGYSTWDHVSADVESANTMMRSQIKLAQRATDQVLLAAASNQMKDRVDLRAGAVNYGAMDERGNQLLRALEPGRYDIAKDLLRDKLAGILDAYGAIASHAQARRSVPEVLEQRALRTATHAQSQASLTAELIHPLVMRELSLLKAVGALPDEPPELKWEEVQVSFQGVGADIQEVGGLSDLIEIVSTAAQLSGNAGMWDLFDWDVVVEETAERLGVPKRWFTTPGEREEVRAKREEQQQASELTKAAPAISGLMKAVK